MVCLESTVMRLIEVQSYDACGTVARKVHFRSSRDPSALLHIFTDWTSIFTDWTSASCRSLMCVLALNLLHHPDAHVRQAVT
jgi:hypothetical protein